jgi:hypothetical protein
MDFLFVRRLGRDSDPQPGWKSRRLIRLVLIPGNDGSAFGFLDPNQVIRAIHGDSPHSSIPLGSCHYQVPSSIPNCPRY